MSAILKHISLRLWLTALVGGVICTMVLPQWQRLAGMVWMALPVTIVLVGLFFLIGWMMNRMGTVLIRRQVAEAAVWERAGRATEAEAAFERAISVYDSFWFSPAQRRHSAEWVAMRLARFHLARPTLGAVGRKMVGAYLRMCPGDEAVAQGWLEEACGRHGLLSEDHELAALIGSALGRHEKIQKLLADFYLSQRRTDFEAMQTYRRVWQASGDHDAERVRALCDLLLPLGHINDWALQLYLKGHAHGDDRCREGLAAALCWLKPGTGNRLDLDAAGQALSHLTDEQVQTLASRFKPPESERPVETEPRSKHEGTALIRQLWDRTNGLWLRLRPMGTLQTRRMAAWGRAIPARLRWVAVFAMIGITAVLVMISQWPSRPDEPQVPPAIAPLSEQPTAEPDPFTIQVAAYLKREDAQRFVDHLKQAGVDAFWTQAKSAQRTWYQVKASHFATKEEARIYGESLKAKGLIDDFYVANHKR